MVVQIGITNVSVFTGRMYVLKIKHVKDKSTYTCIKLNNPAHYELIQMLSSGQSPDQLTDTRGNSYNHYAGCKAGLIG